MFWVFHMFLIMNFYWAYAWIHLYDKMLSIFGMYKENKLIPQIYNKKISENPETYNNNQSSEHVLTLTHPRINFPISMYAIAQKIWWLPLFHQTNRN